MEDLLLSDVGLSDIPGDIYGIFTLEVEFSKPFTVLIMNGESFRGKQSTIVLSRWVRLTAGR
jgi:hypothetical protein